MFKKKANLNMRGFPPQKRRTSRPLSESEVNFLNPSVHTKKVSARFFFWQYSLITRTLFEA